MGALIGWKPVSTDPRLASFRLRCLDLLPRLRERGHAVELLDPRRLAEYRAVVFSKSYDDEAHATALEAAKRGTRIVFDLCDNHFYNPCGLPEWDAAARRLRRMIAVADRVVASTETLAEVIHEEARPKLPITVIGDPIDSDALSPVPPLRWQWRAGRELSRLRRLVVDNASRGVTPLVWFGNHGSPYARGGMEDLALVRAILESTNRRHPLSLTVVSNSREKFEKITAGWAIPCRYLEWNARTFLDALRLHAIAVIPVRDNPFTRCKTSNRPALALACGLAVVADAIPSYRPFASVVALDDWRDGLERYLADPDLRRRHVQLGRSLVHSIASSAVIADRWSEFLHEVLG